MKRRVRTRDIETSRTPFAFRLDTNKQRNAMGSMSHYVFYSKISNLSVPVDFEDFFNKRFAPFEKIIRENSSVSRRMAMSNANF